MHVCHLLWLPAQTNGAFFIWAEDANRLAQLNARARATADLHPYAIAPTVPEHLNAQPHVATLELPTGSRIPIPSPAIPTATVSEKLLAGVATLKPWQVEGLLLTDALTWVADGAPGVALAETSRIWIDAAREALETLANERFLPSIENIPDGTVEARWRVALRVEDWDRIRKLAARFAPAAWCAVTGSASAEACLRAFLDDAIDAWVRRHAPRLEEPQWARSLTNGATIKAPKASLRRWPEQSQHWSALLLAPVGQRGLRTCFRLEAPQEADQPWPLRFLVQAADDPSLLLDGDALWNADTASWLNTRYEHVQQRLLTDLARVARIFPPVERALRNRHPVEVVLTAEEAYTFLRHATPLLQNVGYGVLLPRGWTGGGASLTVRVQVRSPKKHQTVSPGQNFLAFDWHAAIGDQPISREELERLAALKVPLVQVRGQWVEVRPDQLEATLRAWDKLQKRGLQLADILGLQGGAELAEGLQVSDVSASGWVGDALSALTTHERLDVLAPPQHLHGTLRPYQQRGYSWLTFLTGIGLGACLADDMGLGKTLQVLAFIQHDREQGGRAPWLLFCPTSLLGNWRREAARFTPDLKVLVHHGTHRDLALAHQYDVVLSTYALSYRDDAELKAVTWAGVIVDEAQNIKNSETRQARAIASIEAPRRIAMTGTPVENRLSELWSIMNFANPGYLGTATQFHKHFALPIEKLGDRQMRERLQRQVAPLILRRHKTDPTIIQDLPEKMEARVFCTLTKEQASLYQAVVNEQLGLIEQASGIDRRGKILGTLSRLKQICDHPALFLKESSRLDGRSGKLERLGEMLEEVVAAGERALVFTQFAEMGDLLTPWLADRLGREVLFLHGGTPTAERERMVLRFSDPADGPAVFVLSLKAGGVGLNLTAANHVFHFDRWWNPAVENQATDRAFRIGQKKNVQVHKFICGGTLEESIDAMIEQKKDLAETIVGSGESVLTELSTDRLREIFQLREEA